MPRTNKAVAALCNTNGFEIDSWKDGAATVAGRWRLRGDNAAGPLVVSLGDDDQPLFTLHPEGRDALLVEPGRIELDEPVEPIEEDDAE